MSSPTPHSVDFALWQIELDTTPGPDFLPPAVRRPVAPTPAPTIAAVRPPSYVPALAVLLALAAGVLLVLVMVVQAIDLVTL